MNPDDPLGLITPPKQSAADPLGLLGDHKPKTGQMGHPIVDASPEDPSYREQVMGGLASFGRNIPGVEAIQAAARMTKDITKPENRATLGEDYKQGLSEVRAAEASANPIVRHGNSLIGGTIAAALTPGKTAAMQGATFGAASGLASADPQSVGERIGSGVTQGATGAVAGKVLGELAPNVARVIRAKSLGNTALARTGAMEAADQRAYGQAASEANRFLKPAGASSPEIVAALDHPTVKPYANEIRNSPLFERADDATVLREAYKLMTEKQQTLASRVINSSDYKAGSQLEKQEISQGKRQLLNAADNIMPSLRPAVYGHATAKGELDAFRAGADATGRIARNATVAGKKLAQNSPEAFKASIIKMNQDEAKAATEGVLGRLKARAGITANPFRGFGLPKSVSSINKLAPYLDALDQQAGNAGSYARRALGIAAGAQVSN